MPNEDLSVDDHSEQPEQPDRGAHPVRLVVEDELRRNRLTVFFRIILAIPHLIWVILWTILAVVVAIVTWLVTLIAGRPPAGLHGFLSSYVRYTVHLNSYLYLAANPYPGFFGEAGSYPVDVELPGPEPRARWKTLLRIILAIPALLLATALGGARPFVRRGGRRGASTYSGGGGGLMLASGFLGWFVSLLTGRMPRGLRDACAYGVGYNAQVAAYTLLLTDRYPNPDPGAILAELPPPPRHPVRLVEDASDLRRSRLTVFFRLPLAIPHVVWLALLVAARGALRDRSTGSPRCSWELRRASSIASSAPTSATRFTSTRSSTSRRTRSLASPGRPASTRSSFELPAAAAAAEPLEDRRSGSFSSFRR